MKLCVDCKYHKLIPGQNGLFCYYRPAEHRCAHPNFADPVSGEQGADCYAVKDRCDVLQLWEAFVDTEGA